MVKITEEDSSTWGGSDFHRNSSESRKETQSSTISKSTQKNIGGSVAGNQVNFRSSKSNKAMKVSLGMEKGEYVLKLKTGMTDQAQTAAMLSSQAAMLRRLGETLIFLSEFFKSLG